MTFEIAFVLAVLCVMIFCLVKEFARPDMVMFGALAVFLLSGVLPPSQALQGFSNQGMLTIALLFVVAGTIQRSGLLEDVLGRLLGGNGATRGTMLKLLAPASGLSAFFNNTPIVVMLTPLIRQWCERWNIPPSKFLLPLSYATIFGGMITLIGTSTNLVVHGLMLEHGMDGLGMFQLAVIGLPGALLGIIYLLTVGYRLLPNRKPASERIEEETRDYLSEMRVDSDCPLIGKRIEEAGLRNLKGLYLIQIMRAKEQISPVSSREKIHAGDRLIFTGLVSTIVDLQNIPGLRLVSDSKTDLQRLRDGGQRLVEAVVSHQSTLLHQSIKKNRFRSRFDAGVVAVHRNHERIHGKIGEIVLKPGDVLLLLVGSDFEKRNARSDDFYLITPIDTPKTVDRRRAKAALGVFAAMVLLVTFNVLSMFKAVLIAVLVLLLSRTITADDAKRHMEFRVLLLIAASLGVGRALEVTGTAELLATSMFQWGQGLGVIGLLVIIYLLTNLLTEVVTNNAAAVIMFPIAVALAQQSGVEPLAFILTLTIAASASFSTPIGYQTNLIVYGPGGYRYTDYLKIGLPLNLLFLVMTVNIVFWLYV